MKKRRNLLRKIMCIGILGVSSMASCVSSKAESMNDFQKPAYVIIIIDDWGNNMAGSDEMLKLPIPLTGAVIPGMPFDKQDAEKLHAADKEVILHVPLEPEKGKKNWLGPKGITVGMSEEQVLKILNEAQQDLPYIKGMNNHMGSKAMKNEVIVKALMKFAAINQLYFVDSGTTNTTLSEKYTKINGMPFLKRSVFLDNTPSTEHVKGKLRELEEIAKEQGYAIGIGHVGPQKGPHTASALKELIPQMQKEGITFITVSELLEKGLVEK
ncbi:MAG: divergent polysaccharide deacetylase family protein [Cellulosilyticaceae bacterium]